ncbi:CBS domain-containing protein [Litoribacter ruber]|uniref:CBS domain-containing protein n=1 Tax=Litoribacter ruber TaxID=702568 RepID=A0AAP2CFR5_9BACT|nr:MULTISPECIES: CBS domain-containing protein [Litoribacter]MBS9523788.1 CBS domain-containing protein [Litoribacter alkaliphilus]MBT0811621.1 CBS domain-containing protein [Litoribacter ruber]
MDMKETVAEIMTAQVITLDEKASLKEAVSLLRKHKIRHLPVINGNRIVGIISRTDINRLTFGVLMDNQEDADDTILDMLTVPQVMSSKPRVVSKSQTVEEVAKIFTSEDFHALPVVDDGELYGIVTTTDVIRYMLQK